MKPGKAAMALLCVVLLALAGMGGFFLGRNTVAGPVRVITQSPAAQLPQPDTAGTREIPAAEHSSAAGSAPPEEEASDSPSFPIDINTATAEQLQALPGVGEVRAEAIVAYREEHGPFTYVEDLRAVSGIGEGILTNIMDYITVGEQSNG